MTAGNGHRRVTPRGVLVYSGPQNTEEWLQARRSGIGASDVPAIVGASSWATARHVYHDKLGELPDDTTAAARWGHLLEDAVAREWAREHGRRVRRVGIVAHDEHRNRLASLDRLVAGCPRGRCSLEVKTRSAYVADSWREGLPDDVLAQVQWQLHVTGFDHAHVAVLIGGNDFRHFTEEPDPEVIDYLVREADLVWRHVQDRTPPAVDPSGLLLSLLDRLHPDRAGATVIDLDEARRAHRNYQTAAAIKKRAEERMDAAKARAALLLGDADEGITEDGDQVVPLVRWRKQKAQRRVDLDRLKATYPDAYQACVTQGETRVLRFLRGLNDAR
jgi:putative phage-type endonuclease